MIDKDSYTLHVRFTRSLSDDLSVTNSREPMVLAKQLALELQNAYDETSMAGQFQVETVTIDGETTQIEGRVQ